MSDNSEKHTVTIANEIRLTKRSKYSNEFEVMQESISYLEHKGRLATALIERWGLVAVTDAGESSDGRQRGRLLDPQEVVNRACTTANLAIEAFRAHGWEHKVPSSADLLSEE